MMGYAYYELPDGREAGYAVEATCDLPGCKEQIDRGLAYLCGRWPAGLEPPADASLYGCKNYFCELHLDWHAHYCSLPPCASYSKDGRLYCELVLGHEGTHLDCLDQKEFTETEDS